MQLIEESVDNKKVLLKAFELVLEYMDDGDIRCLIECSKAELQELYDELKKKWGL